MRDIRDILLDMNDGTRVIVLALPVVAAALILAGGFYACSNHGPAAADSSAAAQTEPYPDADAADAAQQSEDDNGNGSGRDEAAEDGSSASSEEYLDTGADAKPNGYQDTASETGAAAAEGDVADMEKGQTLAIGNDKITSGIVTHIRPADILSAIRACTGDQTGAIEATITGDADDGRYRQIAVALRDGSMLCLEMPSGTDGPIVARTASLDEIRKINFGSIVGHDDDSKEAASKEKPATQESGQEK